MKKEKLLNFVMLPINHKVRDGQPIVRRVLLSYKSTVEKGDTIYYKGTKFIEKDPYFYDETKSHQYEFKDSYFRLISNSYGSFDNFEKRKYHSYKKPHCEGLMLEYINLNCQEAIFLEGFTVEDAIEYFKNRDELND
mgnify:CR=1 FL=1